VQGNGLALLGTHLRNDDDHVAGKLPLGQHTNSREHGEHDLILVLPNLATFSDSMDLLK
jgi:hypothetical protein